MTTSIERDFGVAAAFHIPIPLVAVGPADPVFESFVQYKRLAELRCVPMRNDVFNMGNVTTAGRTSTHPSRIYTKWTVGDCVVRTQNSLLERSTAGDDERILNYPTGWKRFIHGAWFPRSVAGAAGSWSGEDEGTITHRNILVPNTTRNREYKLLDPHTKDALVHHAAQRYDDFLAAVRTHNSITSDLLLVIRRGPVFKPWMLERLIFDVVTTSVTNFDKPAADAAAAALAHFIVNDGTVVKHRKWKTDSRNLQRYLAQARGSLPDNGMFTLFERIVFQFSAPANVGALTVNDIIERAALTYAIVLHASKRAARQLVHDTEDHVRRVSLGTSVLFAALSFAAGASPVPLLANAVNNLIQPINTAVTNLLSDRVSRVNDIANAVDNLFLNQILIQARLGYSVPGLLGVLAADPTLSARNPIGDRRRELGKFFEKQCNYYVSNLDEENTRMTKL